MGDRIALMRDGRILQLGPPETLYFRPADRYVATFLGEVNRLPGQVRGGRAERRTRAASTLVRFADITDAELDAYVASGEPQQVAGAFTVDGLGSAFVTGLDGDPHNVVGISVPLLRVMFAELGLDWVSFWAHG